MKYLNQTKKQSDITIDKIKKLQVFTDPIYGFIFIDYVVLKKLINTQPLQRLKKIKQLSFVNIVFNCAEHSRFSHSLGVYELARRFIEINEKMFNKREELLLLTTSLLHDVGHGPFSHAFEQIAKINHERKSVQIIKENLEIVSILDEIDKDFKNDIADIILKKSKFPLIEQLITSSLDFDRLDYLKRDSFFSGISYGNIDVNYLMRKIEIDDKNQNIVFNKSVICSIENYLISRYHMYCRLYNNKKVLGYTAIFIKLFERINYLFHQKYDFENLKNNGILTLFKKFIDSKSNDISLYLQMNDNYINTLIMFLKNEKDAILVNLSNDFLNRNIWLHTKDEEKIKKKFNYSEEDSRYYIYNYKKENKIDNTKKIIYDQKKDKILIYENNKFDNITLDKTNTIIKKLLDEKIKKTDFYFFYRDKNLHNE
ncbi:HD superfamily phosphohydrolase [Candidatus Phytoplasma luffae]|uniref:HD superfamily phosphohydrolase n=1 Tax=Loofah witches'-broom phytoplasma TaxID=35773 RepID=A0A975FJQ3_LOWBP|nr:HD domain-containing protein [Candidatus Phytoplasma luffae]QTX03239.1 HD superfamily phosphohydrolase [Candidatus Phytoplasma luffae]